MSRLLRCLLLGVSAVGISCGALGQTVPALTSEQQTIVGDTRDALILTGDAGMATLLEHVESWPDSAGVPAAEIETGLDACFALPDEHRGALVSFSGRAHASQRTRFEGVGEVLATLIDDEDHGFVVVISPLADSSQTITGRPVDGLARFLKIARLGIRVEGDDAFDAKQLAVLVGPVPVVQRAGGSSSSPLAIVVGVFILLVFLVVVRTRIRSGEQHDAAVRVRPETPLRESDLPEAPDEALAELRRRHEEGTDARR